MSHNQPSNELPRTPIVTRSKSEERWNRTIAAQGSNNNETSSSVLSVTEPQIIPEISLIATTQGTPATSQSSVSTITRIEEMESNANISQLSLTHSSQQSINQSVQVQPTISQSQNQVYLPMPQQQPQYQQQPLISNIPTSSSNVSNFQSYYGQLCHFPSQNINPPNHNAAVNVTSAYCLPITNTNLMPMPSNQLTVMNNNIPQPVATNVCSSQLNPPYNSCYTQPQSTQIHQTQTQNANLFNNLSNNLIPPSNRSQQENAISTVPNLNLSLNCNQSHSSQNQFQPNNITQPYSQISNPNPILAGCSNASFNISNNPNSVTNFFTNSPQQQWSNSFSNLNQQLLNNSTQYLGGTRVLQDLPEFDGTPRKWPLFIAQFIGSTNENNYSNLQNTYRLSKALKGVARGVVESLLLNPNNVRLILQQLEFLYGRPELLIDSQMEEIKSINPIPENRLQDIITFSIKIQNLVSFLETLPNSNIHLCNPTLCSEIVSKLPVSKQDQWIRQSLNIVPYYTLKDFSVWLSREAQYLSLIKFRPEPTQSTNNKNRVLILEGDSSKNLCRCCKIESHTLVRCPEFKKLSIADRWSKVKELKCCFSCLRTGHQTINCSVKRLCNINQCDKYHNRHLHQSMEEAATCNNINQLHFGVQEEIHREEFTDIRDCNNCYINEGKALFKILPVKMYGPDNNFIEVLALLDEGANVIMIDSELFDQLGYDRCYFKRTNMTVKWYGETTITEPSNIVSVMISGNFANAPIYVMNDVRTISKLNLPSQSLNTSDFPEKFENFRKIPVNYNCAKPKILIGLDNLNICYSKESFEECGLVASNTHLGWTIYGKTNIMMDTPRCHIAEIINENLENSLKNLCEEYFNAENEELIPENIPLNPDFERALDILKSTTSKIDGHQRYETGLLWKSDVIDLPDNFSTAYNRLLHIEDRMKNDINFAEKYEAGIMQYLKKNYARKLSKDEILLYPKRRWYLPHFVSLNPNKPSKFRIVFDAASKHKGISLNSMLMKGPDLNQPLIKVLLNFRIGKFAVCGDIQEMFNQIKIIQKDQHCQRFLWRHGNPKNELETYVMTSMTFGAACSPCSAQYVKNENAKNFLKSNFDAANAIQNSHYVDDFAMSFDTEKKAIEITNSVRAIHKEAGFNLRNFVTNSPLVAKSLADTHCSNLWSLDKTSNPIEKILGLHWNYEDDTYMFLTKFRQTDSEILELKRYPTKREVLSIIMSIFDPFGFLNNFTIQGRIMLQDIWKANIKWDKTIPENFYDVWTKWISSLPNLKKIKIPRYFLVKSISRTELHTFTDASDRAFVAVCYIRTLSLNGEITVSFVMSKTKLAPIKKKLTIPRLELQGALLGGRLKDLLFRNLNITIDEYIFWCDSKVVISWINSNFNNFKPFVSHRIAQIQELTKPEQWHWLSSKENVADEASKIHRNIVLDSGSRWFSGPSFLMKERNEWPKDTQIDHKNSNENLVELKKIYSINVVDRRENILKIERFSSFWTMTRVLGWVLRCKNLFLQKSCRKDLPETLTPAELKNAELYLIKIAQQDSFGIEINNITRNKMIPESSHIKNLCPFIDSEGILRVDGRLMLSWYLTYKRKNPIILPKDHVITELIVQEYHKENQHSLTQSTINNIRMRFWIPRLKQLVKKVEFKCIECKVTKAKKIVPRMGNLPLERLSPYVRPFTFSGIDFFGPFSIKRTKQKSENWWVLIITCMTVRAVHMEVVEKLNAESVLLRLNDFINRRGLPTRIRSDCASYFKSANKRLHEILTSSEVLNGMGKRGIEWVHNCPATPHLGGSWERLIRCVKRVLDYSMKNKKVGPDTFRSFIIESENIINNRPLTDVPLEVEEDEPITPNHFLIGSCNNRQDVNVTEISQCTRKQLNILKMMKRAFWKKWVNEYIPQFNRRTKWYNEPDATLNLGDLVFIEKNYKWVKGLVRNLYHGNDKRIRFVDVTTSDGIVKKHVSKILVPDFREVGECENIENTGRKKT